MRRDKHDDRVEEHRGGVYNNNMAAADVERLFSLIGAASSVSSLLVGWLSDCVQSHFVLRPLVTPLGNKK